MSSDGSDGEVAQSTDETDDGNVTRIEKTAVGPIEAYQLDQIRQEVELIAVDSLPKLDTSTVRIEQIDRLNGGMREITISGEKSEFYGCELDAE